MENKVEAGLFLARIERKCDVIIGMLHDLAGNPDFLIESLRKSVEKQRNESGFRMEIRRGHGTGADRG